jgi:hypothetical protein
MFENPRKAQFTVKENNPYSCIGPQAKHSPYIQEISATCKCVIFSLLAVFLLIIILKKSFKI